MRGACAGKEKVCHSRRILDLGRRGKKVPATALKVATTNTSLQTGLTVLYEEDFFLDGQATQQRYTYQKTMAETTEPSLRGLFNQAKNQQEELESLDPRTATFNDTFRSIVDCLQQCRQLIQQLSLFSPNEELEDIATQDLQYVQSPVLVANSSTDVLARYLTVDCLLAEMKIRAYSADRLSSLQSASESLESFLTRLDQYGLLGSSDRELYERYLEQRSTFRIVTSQNAEDKRRIKIARFQEEKSLKQKLQVRGRYPLAAHSR